MFSYNLISKAICSDCRDFCLQIFVYNCVFWKKEKQHSQNLLHFENESTLQKRTTFWKMKAHSETHFEDKMFLKKWKVIIPFFKNYNWPKVSRKVQECLLVPNSIDWKGLNESKRLSSQLLAVVQAGKDQKIQCN